MKETLVYVVLLSFSIKYVMTIPVISKVTPSSIARCLIQILDNYFIKSLKLSVSFEDGIEANKILQSVDVPVVLNTAEYRKDLGVYYQVLSDVIIILDEIDVNIVINTTLWCGDSCFLVVLNSSSNIKNIFSIFWSHKIVNVYILAESDENGVTVYGFLPHGLTDCGVGDPIIVDRWKDNKFETENIIQILDREKIKSMNGCPVNVASVDSQPFTNFDISTTNRSSKVDGIEGKLIIEISKVLNFNVSFHVPSDGEAWGYVKPKPIGAVGDVFTGYSDFAIGLLGPVIGRYETLDFSDPYSPMECVTFGVPRGVREKQKVWITFLLSEFSKPLWAGMALSVIATIIAYLVFNKLRRRRFFESNVTVVFYVLANAIGTSAKEPVFRELKILYVLWAYVGYLFTATYQSALSSKLAVPTADKDIETFEQLLASNLKLTGVKNIYMVLYYNRGERNIGRLLDQYVVTNQSVESAVALMAKERNIAYVRHKSSFIYYSLLDEGSKGKVNVLKDCIYVYYPTLMLKKYSPYTNQVNKIIDRLKRGGVIKHWLSFYIYDVPMLSDPLIKLSLQKLKGIFFFWLAGLAVSILAFISEWLYYLRAVAAELSLTLGDIRRIQISSW